MSEYYRIEYIQAIHIFTLETRVDKCILEVVIRLGCSSTLIITL